MNEGLSHAIDRIAQLPPDWHGAGSVSPSVLRAIVARAEALGTIRHSVETGSGKTTLLFSHLSADHLVFALDGSGSIHQVKHSPLFNRDHVTFIEGPTQLTLPNYTFTHKVQIALIDGPHGYPFPDLEYYYLYPLLETGGLLLVDDIQIPTIRRMFEIIKADHMFDLLEIVDNTAFFHRSSAPLIDPVSDSWWLQGYNRPYYQQFCEQSTRRDPVWSTAVAKRALRLLTRIVPKPLKKLVPESVKARFWDE